jgi:hypothetical protein
MIPDFPNARQAMFEIWSRALFAGLNGTDPLMSEIPVRVQKEGNAAFVSGNEMEYKKLSVRSSFPMRDAEGMQLDEFLNNAFELGASLAREQAKGMFKKLAEPSPHMMAVNFERPLKFQQVLETWGKMEMSFGDDGKPVWPTIFLGNDLHAEFRIKMPEWLKDPEFKRQIEELISRKRKEFDEREARRRLVE